MVKQYKHLLVPLDSSTLAELAVEDALNLARIGRAELTLLHVVPPIEEVLAVETGHPIFIDQQWDHHRTAAQKYLKDVCKRLSGEDTTIHLAVEMGAPAETIIDYAEYHKVDLIVMATHGRSGLQRWVYGSVADKVLRGASVPILLVRPYLKSKPAELSHKTPIAVSLN
jgi:nucleotide-binding universal stress UspA family protein